MTRASHLGLNKALALALAAALTAGCLPLHASAAYAESAEEGAVTTMAESPSEGAASEGATSEGAADGQETDGILLVLDDDSGESLSLLAAAEDGESEGISALNAAGLVVTDQVTTSDDTVVLEAQPAWGQSIEEALDAAGKLPGVSYAQPNYVYYLIEGVEGESEAAVGDSGVSETADSSDTETADGTSVVAESAEGLITLATSLVNDPFAQNESSTQPQNQYWLYGSNIDDAWEDSACQGSVTVAVLDSGIMPDHEDLAANVLDNLAWDAYYQRDLDTSANLGGDNSGHGSHAAGIIAGVANNGVGLAGASYNASILPVKVFDDTSDQKSSTVTLIRAYDHVLSLAESGEAGSIRVINMSLGSYNDTLADVKKVDGVDRLLEDCIKTAKYDYGIVTVCAGGNGNSSTTPDTRKIYPADFKDCVSVTALEPDGTNIVWSDYNAFKDISAYGRSIWSVQATDTGQTDLYRAQSGTSMASPIVAGVFALLFAAVPEATVDQACEAVYLTATAVEDPDDNRTQASGSHGMIDAAAALGYLTSGQAKDFSDVPDNAWYYESVYYASTHGIMSGYEDSGAFDPEGTLTREQAACVLYNYLDNGEVSPAAWQTDVEQGEWYSEGVNWCVANGIMSGYSGTDLFGVGDLITREQLACVIANAAQADLGEANPAAFLALWDSSAASSYAVPSLVWAVGNGIINGIDDGTHSTRTLSPQGSVTRSQTAAIMMNSVEGGLL